MFAAFLPALFAIVVSWALTPVTMRLASACGAIDYPGPRKIHSCPIPRLGGVAVVLAAVTASSFMVLLPWFEGAMVRDLARALGVALVPLFVVSLIDDLRSLGPAPRLVTQIVSAMIAVRFGIHLNPDIHLFGSTVHLGILAIPISVVWIVGVTNAFNLADGLDGLSAGLALISALSLSALDFMIGGPQLAALPLVLVGSLIGFLPFNLYPARVFLGDAGAASLGFCLACFGLRSGAALSSGVAILVPVLVIGIPVLDTGVTIARRVVKRARQGGGGVFKPDRDHLHHRLLQKGLGHQNTVLLLYGIAAVVAALAVGSIFVTSRNAALLTVTLFAAAFIGVGRLRYDEFAVIRRGALLQLYDAPMLRMSIFPVFVDIGIVLTAFYLALGLKFEDWTVRRDWPFVVDLLAILPATAVAAFALCRLYRDSWRHANIEDLARSSLAVMFAVTLGYIVSAFIVDATVNLSFFAIYGMLLLLLINGARSSFRVLSYWRQRERVVGERVVIYGAGAAGALALREILRNATHQALPLGFIDDDPWKQGRLLNGYPILGSLETLERVLVDHKVRGVIVGSERIPLDSLLQARSICSRAGVWLMRFSVGLTALDASGRHARSIAFDTQLSA
jgi:UDP-GlcNAc:undecaprenyl-phosphate GlcNAc-1-phosphate transferase